MLKAVFLNATLRGEAFPVNHGGSDVTIGSLIDSKPDVIIGRSSFAEMRLRPD